MTVIRLVGLVSGQPSPFDGQYLVEYDPCRDGVDPDGRQMFAHVVTSPDIADAKRFPGPAHAHAEWTRIDRRDPLRADGKLNRPLTAFTLEFE